MSRKPSRRTRSRKSNVSYDKLEPRQLLAALFMGTNGNDNAEVAYVDETHVDITINDTLHENVDITDGVRINLAGNSTVIIGDVGRDGDDTISIDHRITGNLGIFNTEVIHVIGGDNHWKIGFIPDPLPPGSTYFDTNFGVPGVTAGRLNGNITLSGFSSVSTAEGNDTFDINLDWNYPLLIGSGAGDDLFRFNASHNTNQNLNFEGTFPTSVFLTYLDQNFYGDAGNDRFLFHGMADVNVRGGDGYDIVDHSRSTNTRLIVNAREVIGDNWFYGNDKVIGAAGSRNFAMASHAQNPILSWIVNGRRTKLIDPASGATMEFENFTDFKGNAIAQDQFWVLRTASDISIVNADWIQVSSDLDPLKGNLNSINHSISVVRGPVDKMFPPNSPPVQTAPASPKVIISDASGDGLTANFGMDLARHNQVFSRNGSAIRFVDEAPAGFGTSTVVDVKPDFLPELTVHGSQTAADFFRVDGGWKNLELHSHGGNDVFFVGSTVDGLERIGNLKIIAGKGVDRLYANNQGPDVAVGLPEYGYQNQYNLSDTSLEVSAFAVPGNSVFGPVIDSWTANLDFNVDLDIVRVVGAKAPLYTNRFSVAPSATTTFAVVGKSPFAGSDDSLAVRGPLALPNKLINTSVPGQGAVSFGDRAKTIYFYELNALIFEIEMGAFLEA